MPTIISVGDTVKVTSDLDALKQVQVAHGGWNPNMAAVCIIHL